MDYVDLSILIEAKAHLDNAYELNASLNPIPFYSAEMVNFAHATCVSQRLSNLLKWSVERNIYVLDTELYIRLFGSYPWII